MASKCYRITSQCPPGSQVFYDAQLSRVPEIYLDRACSPYSNYRCAGWPDGHSAEYSPPKTYRLNLRGSGTITPEFLWFPEIILVTEQFANKIDRQGWTGFEWHSVDVLTKPLAFENVVFRELRITGSATLKWNESGIGLAYQCKHCGYQVFARNKQEVSVVLRDDVEKLPNFFFIKEFGTVPFISADSADTLRDMCPANLGIWSSSDFGWKEFEDVSSDILRSQHPTNALSVWVGPR